MGHKIPLNGVDVDLSMVELPDARYDRENRERDDMIERDLDEGVYWYEGWDE